MLCIFDSTIVVTQRTYTNSKHTSASTCASPLGNKKTQLIVEKQQNCETNSFRMPRFVGHLWQVVSCCLEENLDCRRNLRLKRPSFVSSAENNRVRSSRSNRRRNRKLDSKSPLCCRHLGRSTDGSPRRSPPWRDLLKTTSCTPDWQSWPAEKAKHLRIDIQ